MISSRVLRGGPYFASSGSRHRSMNSHSVWPVCQRRDLITDAQAPAEGVQSKAIEQPTVRDSPQRDSSSCRCTGSAGNCRRLPGSISSILHLANAGFSTSRLPLFTNFPSASNIQFYPVFAEFPGTLPEVMCSRRLCREWPC